MTDKTIAVYADTRGAAKCRGCGAAITWAEVVKTGRRMCFDGSPTALRTSHDAAMRLVEELDLAANHWKSCPDADNFRRRK